LSDAVFHILNSPKIVCQPGSVGRAYSAPPDSVAELKGPLCSGEGRKGKEKEGEERWEWTGYPLHTKMLAVALDSSQVSD